MDKKLSVVEVEQKNTSKNRLESMKKRERAQNSRGGRNIPERGGDMKMQCLEIWAGV